jgi:hypothetical protein
LLAGDSRTFPNFAAHGLKPGAGCYIFTALAAIVYYRRRVLSGMWDAIFLGVLPLGATGSLAWMFVKTLQTAPWSQRWSVIAVIALGLVMMVIARLILRSPFFQVARESDSQPVKLAAAREAPKQAPAGPGQPVPFAASARSLSQCSSLQ